ncbi:MAG: 4'-phosphopantetheinyl transferase superfamily protein [Defluviitaleaceae bacterium]|nr:4'-phosphopantetheinyl transferase superfamily protein [Defluviitaleaceae bacterium]
MLEVSILEINPELKQSDFDALLPFVAEDRQEKINKFHFYKDARNCLLGDILARNEICRITGFKNNQLNFDNNKYGKPHLVSDASIHFNISHAENYVACAVSDEPVGIDIEINKSFDIKIAERFFMADEVLYIKNADKATMAWRFYEVWIKKESRIKWEGKGLHMPLTSFSVFQCDEIPPVNYYEVFRNDEYICYLCTKKTIKPITRIMNTTSVSAYLKMHIS